MAGPVAATVEKLFARNTDLPTAIGPTGEAGRKTARPDADLAKGEFASLTTVWPARRLCLPALANR